MLTINEVKKFCESLPELSGEMIERIVSPLHLQEVYAAVKAGVELSEAEVEKLIKLRRNKPHSRASRQV